MKETTSFSDVTHKWCTGRSIVTLWLLSQGGVLSVLGSLGMMFWLAMTPHNSETEKKRLAILAGFAFLTGTWCYRCSWHLACDLCCLLIYTRVRVYKQCFLSSLLLQVLALAPRWTLSSLSIRGIWKVTHAHKQLADRWLKVKHYQTKPQWEEHCGMIGSHLSVSLYTYNWKWEFTEN